MGTTADKNRQFILNYYRTISGKKKTTEVLTAFTSDSKLIEHILFFEKVFPHYEVIPDEITTENNRVIVQGRRKGKFYKPAGAISPEDKEIELPFAVGYRIANAKIVDHWFITDQIELP